ncbi:2'-5' RNA ligase family protein [Arthrobacter sp. CAN_A1]|uniref:2'-5' RNA ligase family protein n=1 Tax=Arthrobacter sp. CAN_A1 TaxID=2787717 RepID=UPI0018C8EFCA
MDSIELLLDDVSEQFIRAEWNALLAAGLPSRASHNSPHNRPHITLIAAPVITGDRDGELRERLSLPLMFSCAGLLLFDAGRRGFVLARQVICSQQLLHLHQAAHDAGNVDGPVSTSLPGAWVPHITLANSISTERLPDALAVLSGSAPQGSVTGARRWDSRAKTITLLG